MGPSNNLSVLPFYTDLRYQNHRKSFAYGAIFPLITPDRRILPFQIMRETRSNSVSVFLHDRYGQQVANITANMNGTGLQVVRFQSFGYDVITYSSTFPISTPTPEGIYYLRISDGVQTWYSDMFTVVRQVDCPLKIEWFDAEDLVFDAGRIVYEGIPFKNTLYLNTEIGKPEYVFEEEGESRDGYFFPEKQISEKTYRFTFLAPEYLCDAIRLIRLSDFVTVTTKGQVFECDSFLVTPQWQTQGDIASVEAEFQCATVVKKIGRGVIEPGMGDFNEDFNDDFNHDQT